MRSQPLDLAAGHWRIGDLVVLADGTAATVTLHRLEGAPPQVIVEFAGLPGHRRYSPTAPATVFRTPTPAAAGAA